MYAGSNQGHLCVEQGDGNPYNTKLNHSPVSKRSGPGLGANCCQIDNTIIWGFCWQSADLCVMIKPSKSPDRSFAVYPKCLSGNWAASLIRIKLNDINWIGVKVKMWIYLKNWQFVWSYEGCKVQLCPLLFFVCYYCEASLIVCWYICFRTILNLQCGTYVSWKFHVWLFPKRCQQCCYITT